MALVEVSPPIRGELTKGFRSRFTRVLAQVRCGRYIDRSGVGEEDGLVGGRWLDSRKRFLRFSFNLLSGPTPSLPTPSILDAHAPFSAPRRLHFRASLRRLEPPCRWEENDEPAPLRAREPQHRGHKPRQAPKRGPGAKPVKTRRRSSAAAPSGPKTDPKTSGLGAERPVKACSRASASFNKSNPSRHGHGHTMAQNVAWVCAYILLRRQPPLGIGSAD